MEHDQKTAEHPANVDMSAPEVAQHEAAPDVEMNGTDSVHMEPENGKDTADDVGEVMEGDEDTVIY